MRIGTAAGRIAFVGAALLSLACRGPTQRVPLSLEPSPLSVFVDGTQVPGAPSELVLRSDQAHVLFFRKQGFQSQRIVLRTAELEGKPILQPSEVHVRLLPAVPSDRELVIEPAAP